jgi:CRP/FNR family cyclic AMP-dependent transcriptional regulator
MAGLTRMPAQSYRILAQLDPLEVQGILAQAPHRDLTAGETVVREGERNASLFLIESGGVEVLKRTPDAEEVLGHLGAGNFFGELSVFDPGPASATVRAARVTRLRVLEGSRLDSYLTDHPVAARKLYIAVLSELALRLRRLDSKLVEKIVWVRREGPGRNEP